MPLLLRTYEINNTKKTVYVVNEDTKITFVGPPHNAGSLIRLLLTSNCLCLSMAHLGRRCIYHSMYNVHARELCDVRRSLCACVTLSYACLPTRNCHHQLDHIIWATALALLEHPQPPKRKDPRQAKPWAGKSPIVEQRTPCYSTLTTQSRWHIGRGIPQYISLECATSGESQLAPALFCASLNHPAKHETYASDISTPCV